MGPRRGIKPTLRAEGRADQDGGVVMWVWRPGGTTEVVPNQEVRGGDVILP